MERRDTHSSQCRKTDIMAKKSQSTATQFSSKENIEIPPISKSVAGAATGAVVGAVAGPLGAVVGGVIGAAIGKRAESGKPMMPAIKRTARQAAEGARVVARAAGPVARRAAKAVRPGKSAHTGPKKSSGRSTKSSARRTNPSGSAAGTDSRQGRPGRQGTAVRGS